MDRKRGSPRVTHLSWGKVKVEGYSRTFKDVKLFPGGAREWDWRETGTNHEDGIQPADVQELLDKGARTIILSRGKQGRLRVSPATYKLLEDQGIEPSILLTDDAVENYNQLCSEGAVGALIHSTC